MVSGRKILPFYAIHPVHKLASGGGGAFQIPSFVFFLTKLSIPLRAGFLNSAFSFTDEEKRFFSSSHPQKRQNREILCSELFLKTSLTGRNSSLTQGWILRKVHGFVPSWDPLKFVRFSKVFGITPRFTNRGSGRNPGGGSRTRTVWKTWRRAASARIFTFIRSTRTGGSPCRRSSSRPLPTRTGWRKI